MKTGDLLIYITAAIALIGFMFMFGMGLFYMENTAIYGLTGIITLLSGSISIILISIKNEI